MGNVTISGETVTALSTVDTEAKIAAADSLQSANGSNTSGSNAAGGDADTGAIKVAFAKNGAKPAIVVTAKLANGNTVTLKEGKSYYGDGCGCTGKQKQGQVCQQARGNGC